MRVIFVTGGSGVVGTALVPLLLQDPDARVCLLLRAGSPTHLKERLSRLLAFCSLPADEARIEAVIGDVCEPRLGLDDTTHARLAREVTHVVHAAGDVYLDRPLAEARRSAVGSVEAVLAFCRACAGFTKLEHVSTVGVAGKARGLIPESPLPRPRAFHNTYEEAKSEGEDLVLEAMAAGLPATVHRPSMVVGDSRTGRIVHFQVFHHLSQFLAGARTGGILPDAGTVRLDLIPSDWVARAILTSMARVESTGRIFHLCSGPEFALTVDDMADRLHALFAHHGAPPPPLRRVPLASFLDELAAMVRRAEPGDRRFLAALPRLLEYYEDDQRFDNARTRAFFADAGLRVPAVDSYLAAQVQFFFSARGIVAREA